MPELPEVETVRRLLEPALRGVRIDAVRVRRADLRIPFPPRFAERLAGETVRAVDRRAKYLLIGLSSGETLIVHLGMTGWFTIGTAVQAWDEPDTHDHVVFRLATGAIVTFSDQRRFGLMDLVAPGALTGYPPLADLGPEPLSDAFDADALAQACRGRRTPLKSALLDQRVVAGLGNIYVVEALHRAGLSPMRRASTIATPTGRPRPGAVRLVAEIKQVLEEAIAAAEDVGYRGGRLRVYEREGLRCRRPRCPGVIRRRVQAGRSTYYCPVCQR